MLVYLSVIDSADDRAKFEQLYRQYRGVMGGIAYHFLGSWADAEDIVHQAFVYIAGHMEKISDPMCIKTKSYIAIIVENKSIDLLRRRQRRGAVPLDEAIPSLAAPMGEEGGLAAAIARLDGRQRELILLKYAYGYTNSECAEFFGLSDSGLRSLDQRAKAKLRELLREEGIEV